MSPDPLDAHLRQVVAHATAQAIAEAHAHAVAHRLAAQAVDAFHATLAELETLPCP